MRFQVPQFIEVEDKIFGQLTLKQFIYLAGGGGLAFVVYVLLKNIFIALIPIAIIVAFSLALAFYRINNKPFIYIVESAFRYWIGSKLYVWRKGMGAAAQASAEIDRHAGSLIIPKITDSKLKDLTWSLDIKESMYSDKK